MSKIIILSQIGDIKNSFSKYYFFPPLGELCTVVMQSKRNLSPCVTHSWVLLQDGRVYNCLSSWQMTFCYRT